MIVEFEVLTVLVIRSDDDAFRRQDPVGDPAFVQGGEHRAQLSNQLDGKGRALDLTEQFRETASDDLIGNECQAITFGEPSDRAHAGQPWVIERCKFFNALAEGGQITMPIADQFWGDYFGSLTDRFGVNWMVNYTDPTKRHQ